MRWYLSLLAALALAAAPSLAREQISVPSHGIEMAAPDGWTRIPSRGSLDHLRGVEFDSPEFQQSVETSRNEPIIALRKEGSDRELIPSVNVGMRPLADFGLTDPMRIAERTAYYVRQAFADARILEGPRAVQVGGVGAAHVRVGYSHVADGVRMATVSEYWVIPYGRYLIFIGCGYSPDEPAETRAEILAMVDSIRLAPRR